MPDITYGVDRLVDWIHGMEAEHDLSLDSEPFVEPTAVDHAAGTVEFTVSTQSGYVPRVFRVTIEEV